MGDNDDDDWDVLTPGKQYQENGGGEGGTYSPPSSPLVEDDGTTSVMLYDIQFRMTDSHVVYVLQLKFKGIPNPGWTITKRYRQFADLHKKLTRTCREPKLPGSCPNSQESSCSATSAWPKSGRQSLGRIFGTFWPWI